MWTIAWSIALLLVILIYSLILTTGPTSAQSSGQYDWPSCFKSGRTQLDLTACAASRLKLADDRMEKAYREVACHFDDKKKKELAEIQNLWSVFRDKNCAFWRLGGSVDRMNEFYCRAHLAEERAAEFESWPFNAPQSVMGPCP
jgi:uncharacterized protein YecT (DUF1311 family)